jgi:hypothetical protein
MPRIPFAFSRAVEGNIIFSHCPSQVMIVEPILILHMAFISLSSAFISSFICIMVCSILRSRLWRHSELFLAVIFVRCDKEKNHQSGVN